MDTSTSSTVQTVDLSPILKNQENEYNMIHDYFLFSIVLNGLLIALILVQIFVKGFQSNAR
jgi:hypothetical protein